MKHTKRILAVLMALFMLMNGVVLAHADYEDGKECPECGNYRWDDWVECYDCGMCIDCAADYICPSCGECTYCAGDRCDGCGACPDCGDIICSECESQCFKCADDSKFCITCDRCGECNGETVCPGCTETCGECGTYDQCDDDCLFCENCADICTECGDKCYNCADEDEFCQACGRCGKCNGDTVCPGCHENCGECESKDYCSECFYCEDCGEMICTECGKACFNCSSDDKFCVSCGRCGECNGETVCPGCCETCGECSTYDECDGCLYCENCADYICENCGDTCTNCADEFEFCDNCDLCLDCNGGTTCPECAQSCFECEYVPQCSECYRCEDCAVLCLGCDKVCEDCAEDWCQSCGLCGDCNGHTACPDCGETCMECNEYGQCYDCYTCEQCTTICEECGEICIDCAYSFCENCNTCSECNGDTVCETCYNTCALCEANPQCKECLTCENCVLLCTGCGEVCMECAADGWCTGCDTCADCNGGTACLDCGNSCLECETIEQCADCYLCANCTTVCTGCGDVCIDCAADGWCTGCDTCADCNGGTACPDCGETCESCGNEDQCGGCYNCAACADICINCGDFCSMCDLDYNEETHMCGNCDVHDVDAAAVIGKINAIGTVELTPESKAKIDAAAAAFKSLSDEQQALVGNFNTLRAAQAEYKQLKNQEDKRKANLVTAGINNLGTISFSSESNKKIAIAKNMYASLTADQKALVTNYDVLEAAIARYDELKQEAYDQAAADDVIGRISAIGTVIYSDSSALKISRARNDYNVLTNTQKALVTNYSVLTAAEAKYAQLQAAANQTAADKAAVENAVQKINAIGKVEYTSDCKVKMDEARNIYNALTATQKALVTNYAVLTEAEAKYAEMEALHEAIDAINAIGAVGFTTECKAKIDAARNAYNALSDAQKAQITNYKTLTAAEAEYAKLKAAADLAAADQAAADAVIAKIGAIGTVDNTDASKAKIDVARNAYNALSYKQKSLVTNFNLLTAAETKYAQMKKSVDDKAAADSASAKISAIGTVEYSAESKKKINDAAVAYNALTAEQKALVDNHATLAAAQAKYDELKAAAVVSVTGISLDKYTLTLTEGESVDLVATVAPENATNKNVKWSSDNESVLTVDADGKVTALSMGKAKVTVTTNDGKFTAVCEVEVLCSHKNAENRAETAPTCTENGYKAGKYCTDCKKWISGHGSIPATGHTYTNACDKDCNICKAIRTPAAHSYKNVTTKATLSKNGKVENKCSVCGYVSKTTTVYYPKTIKLSTTSYTYNGKTKKPSVTVKDSKGNTLKKDTDYTVKYESGRKSPGKYTVTVTFKGKYTGTKKLYFTIAPKATSKITATQTTTTVTLKWNKVTGADGYRVYKYNSKTKKYEKLKDVTKTTLKISKLKAGTIYKYKVRAYTKDDGTIWGDYSKVFETATKCKTPKITKLTTTKGKATVKWSNVSGESGYQVYYSTKKDSGYKKVKSYKVNVVKGSKSKLTSGKKYYFKVRAYKKTASGTVYSAWSAVKSVKIK